MNTILIVDDEPHVIHVIKQFLARFGYRIISASNGAQALTVIDKEHPDVLVTDIQMPKMSGQELCSAIESDPGDYRPLMIIMTSRTDHELRTWSESFPNAKFMEKPLSLRRLSTYLNDYFSAIQSDG